MNTEEQLARINAEITRLKAEREEIARPEVDAEAAKWARMFCDERRKINGGWMSWSDLGDNSKGQFITAMRPVGDGIKAECRAEWRKEREERIKEYRELHEELGRTRCKLSVTDGWREKFRVQADECRAENQRLQGRVKDLAEECNAARKAKDNLAFNLERVTAERDELHAELVKYQSQIGDDPIAVRSEIDSLKDQLADVIAERDRYKPFHDGLMDAAVVNWTYGNADEKDYQLAIQKLVANHIHQAADPAISEDAANVQAQLEAMEVAIDQYIEETRSLRVEIATITAARDDGCHAR